MLMILNFELWQLFDHLNLTEIGFTEDMNNF